MIRAHMTSHLLLTSSVSEYGYIRGQQYIRLWLSVQVNKIAVMSNSMLMLTIVSKYDLIYCKTVCFCMNFM